MNPYYQDDSVTIYHGDAFAVWPKLTGQEFDAVVTDPPYGIGWKPRVNHQDQAWVDKRVNLEQLISAPYACVWGGNYYTDVLPPSESWLAWIKRPAGFDFDNDGRTYSVLELAWTNYGGKPKMRHHVWDGGLRSGDPSNREFSHPAQKPLEIMRWSISLCPVQRGVLFDPFAGSGTTLRAAKDLGWRAVGIEIDERYCDIAARRCAQEVLDLGDAA